jgi:hypothetical protein
LMERFKWRWVERKEVKLAEEFGSLAIILFYVQGYCM